MSQPRISIDSSAKGKLKSGDLAGIFAEAFGTPEHRFTLPSGRPHTENVDPARSHLNEYWKNPRWDNGELVPDYQRAIAELMEEGAPKKKHRKIKPDAVVVRSLVVQTSPSYFFPKMRGLDDRTVHATPFALRGPLDQQALNRWKEAVYKHMQEKWGDRLLGMELHLDESSPHIHVQLVPVTQDGRLSAKDLFSPKELRKGQDEIAKAVAHLGIQRARDKAKGEDPLRGLEYNEWQRLLEQERQRIASESKAKEPRPMAAEALTQFPEEVRLPPAPPKPEPPSKPGLFANRQEKAEYERQVYHYEGELAEWQQQTDPKWRNQEQRRLLIERMNTDKDEIRGLRYQKRELETELKHTKQELAVMTDRALKAEATHLREIPLQEVISRMYPELFQDPKDRTIYRDGYEDNNRKIGITGPLFIDNHDPAIKGKGAIDFVMKMSGCSAKEAIGRLRDYFGTSETLAHLATETLQRQEAILAPCPSTPEPQAPAADPRRAVEVRRWMTSELKVSPELADHLMTTGQIYADEKANALVPRPGGGCFKRGTVRLKSGEKNTFKQTLGSKKAGAAKLEGPESKPQGPVILCEGIADGLTLLDDYPSATVYIVGGNLHPDLPPLDNREIWLAFDKDEAGRLHHEYYARQYPDAADLSNKIPEPFQDWAEYHRQVEIDRQRPRYNPTPAPGM